MWVPRSLWAQLALVILVGGSVGLVYRHHASTETEWLTTHYRLNEAMAFPLQTGLPFHQQHFIDSDGQRVDVPLADGSALDYGSATWWRVDRSGRMRFWNETREEICPTTTAVTTGKTTESVRTRPSPSAPDGA